MGGVDDSHTATQAVCAPEDGGAGSATAPASGAPASPPAPHPNPATSELVRRTLVVSLTVLVVAAVVLFLVRIHVVLLWALVGTVLAIALSPAVSWLERHGWGHRGAALLVAFLAVAAIAGAVVAVALPVVTQTDDFIAALPELVKDLFGPGGQLHALEVRFDVLDRLRGLTPGEVTSLILGRQESIVAFFSRAATLVMATVAVITIMTMLLLEGPRAWRAVLASLTDEERVWAERIALNFLRAVGGWVRGAATLAAIAGLSSYVLLRILGVPYPETLAMVVAVLDIVPLVGATIAAVIVVIVGFATAGVNAGVVLAVFFLAYQQFENNVLQPTIYGRAVQLSPLVVFLAALAGASLAGVIGVVLAIPLTSAGWVLAGDLLALRRERRRREAGAPAPPGPQG